MLLTAQVFAFNVQFTVHTTQCVLHTIQATKFMSHVDEAGKRENPFTMGNQFAEKWLAIKRILVTAFTLIFSMANEQHNKSTEIHCIIHTQKICSVENEKRSHDVYEMLRSRIYKGSTKRELPF